MPLGASTSLAGAFNVEPKNGAAQRLIERKACKGWCVIMKRTLMQISWILVSLGGIAGLVGFLFLPFGLNPIDFRMHNGIQLMQFFPHQIQLTFRPLEGYDSTPFRIQLIISYGAMWVIILAGALLTVLPLVAFFSRKPGIGLPLTCLFLCIAALVSQFLAFYLWWNGTDADLWTLMFTKGGPFTPITGIGWWVSTGGALLALTGSILRLSSKCGGKVALTSI